LRVLDYLQIAYELYQREGPVLPHEAKRLIGGPFSLKQISDITGVSQRWLKNAYKDNERPGGRLNPATLGDIIHLRYLTDIGARLDRGSVWKVVSQGTSTKVLARLIGKRPGEVEAVLDPRSGRA